MCIRDRSTWGAISSGRPLPLPFYLLTYPCRHQSQWRVGAAAVPGERDVLVMRHDVGVEWRNQNEEMIHVNFVIYGDPNKYSAMAATVGYPTAIAAKMVLEGTSTYGPDLDS